MSLYWKCQIGGWTALFFWQIGMTVAYQGSGGLSPWAFVAVMVVTVMGLLLTHLFRHVIHREGWKEMSPMQLAPRVLAATVALGFLMGLSSLPFSFHYAPPEISAWLLLLGNTTGSAFAVFGWFLLYFCYHFLKRSREASEKELELRISMRDNELRTLRSQLNPHFLFNSLNSLRGLIPESPTRAQEAVTSLAGLLRHTLRLSQEPVVRLSRELEAARHYLGLESIRFEDRLEIALDIDPRVMDQAVPPMLLQLLLENALKHGIGRLREGGTVRLEVGLDDERDQVRVEVTNPGRIVESDGEGGLGLLNIRRQLALLFGDDATLVLEETETGRVRCEVRMPRRALSEDSGGGGPSAAVLEDGEAPTPADTGSEREGEASPTSSMRPGHAVGVGVSE
jgi:two-component system, LytTR family, sensor kinase